MNGHWKFLETAGFKLFIGVLLLLMSGIQLETGS